MFKPLFLNYVNFSPIFRPIDCHSPRRGVTQTRESLHCWYCRFQKCFSCFRQHSNCSTDNVDDREQPTREERNQFSGLSRLPAILNRLLGRKKCWTRRPVIRFPVSVGIAGQQISQLFETMAQNETSTPTEELKASSTHTKKSKGTRGIGQGDRPGSTAEVTTQTIAGHYRYRLACMEERLAKMESQQNRTFNLILALRRSSQLQPSAMPITQFNRNEITD